MKKSFLLIIFVLICISNLLAIEIEKLEPQFWWAGMKNSELQILMYGNIGTSIFDPSIFIWTNKSEQIT